jgi:uncharacterized membrane protein required for colicin V production
MAFTNLQFNAIDIGVLIIVIWETIAGIKRGLTKELPRLIGTVAVFMISLWGYRIVGKWLITHTRLAEQSELAYAIAYIVIALFTAAVMVILRTVLGSLATIKFNDSIEKPSGITCGLIRAIIISLHLVFMTGLLPIPEVRTFVGGALSGRATFKAVPFLLEKIGWLEDKNVIPSFEGAAAKEKKEKKSSDKKELLLEEE